MNAPLLITDLDNTLYNWVDFFGPSFRAMVHVINNETGIPEDEITNDFRRVYRKFGVIEYSLSVQSLEIFDQLPADKINTLALLTQKVFLTVARKHLVPYPGVIETLLWAKNSGIRLVCMTNAPINLAEWRLHQLRLSGFFYGLAARKALDEKKRKKRFTGITKLWEFSVEELKPNPIAYNRIIGELNIDPKNVYIVGDNFDKDVKPALQIGATGIWAKYGSISETKNIETIKSITTFIEDSTPTMGEFVLEKSELQINEFSELRAILPALQMNLPGFSD